MTDEPEDGSGSFVLLFLKEVVEYRELLVSRYTAMQFEQECGGTEAEILAAGSGPTVHLAGPLGQIVLPHRDAMMALRRRHLNPFPDAPALASASRLAPG